MIHPSHVVPYGRAATTALADAVAMAQQGDPLAPVTVIVPSNFVGLSMRRLLGAGNITTDETTDERRGIANVSFVTPFQLVELVAADLLLDTRPLTNPVLGAAVRQTLAADPGPYRPVAEHEATEAALAGLFAELSNVDAEGLEAILDEGSTAAKLAVQFHGAIAERLVGFHTERDLVMAAAGRADLAARLRPLGHVVWYLPAPLTPALGLFVNRVLSDASGAAVIVGLSGDAEADDAVWRSCGAAGVVQPRTVDVSAPVGDQIVSVTDAAEEVREVCRRVLELVGEGVPLERIGIFYPAPDPYVRIIEQRFAEAGIVVNGPDRRRLADSVAGRTLLGALDLPGARWRRDHVLALVNAGPVRAGGEPARPTAWDQLSRDAGVIADLSDWRSKLEHHVGVLQRRLDDLDDAFHDAPHAPPPDGLSDESGAQRRRARLAERIAAVADLRAFLDHLATSVATVSQVRTWPDKCEAARILLVDLLGPEHQHARWPEPEQEAFGRVDAALVRLAALHEVEPAPTQAVFVRALRAELDVTRGRHGRFGHGAVYGPLAAAVGFDLDAVFVLGAAEGLLPVPRRDDAILPEAVRLSALDQLESKSARLHHQHRAYLAALAAAPVGRRTITFPRGDLRSSRQSLPSRWLLHTASALAGKTVHATDIEHLGAPVVDAVGSFASGIARHGVATSINERDLVELGRFASAGGDPVEHPLAVLTGAGLAMQRCRSSTEFTEFDGNLAAVAAAGEVGLPTAGERPLSPTRLETWAACGFRYFLQYVLDLADRDDPERIEDMSALDRGSLIHQILERFVAGAIAAGPPTPDVGWPASDRERLHTIANEVCTQYEATGRTGRAVNWRVRRDDLRATLDAFLVADEAFRRSKRATPAAVEVRFGAGGGAPVDIALPDGSSVALQGIADRLDTTDDGRVIVSDYKSGKGKKFDHLDDDPFTAGTTLQLGMYAEGARRHTGADAAEAAYWLVERHGDPFLGYSWTPELRERFAEVLGATTSGIERGVFAATPGDWDTWRMTNLECRYCAFDAVCVRHRGEQAVAKADAPELAVRVALRAPVAEDTVAEDTVAEDTVAEDTVAEDTVAQDTADGDTA